MTEARTARLDAEQVAAAVRARAGVPLVVEGPCPGGQVGAAYVRWPDGRRGVLTWRPGVTLGQVSAGPLAVPALLRAAGYPAPATQLAVQVGDGVAVVQERLPGSAVRHVNAALLDQALALNDRHAGDDVVHGDFHHGNFLAWDGRLTGVVDWGGAGRGDRRFDLVTLRFGLRPDNSTPAARARLDTILDALPDEVLTPAWAHMSLRMADWAIRHFGPADVPYWLALAGTRL